MAEETAGRERSRDIGALPALVLLFVTTFLLRMTGNMVQTTIPLFAQDYLGMDAAQIGLASALFIGAGIASPLLIVSRVRVDSLTASLLAFSSLFALAVPLYYFSDSILSFIALILATSVASSTVMLLMLTSAQTMRPGSAHRTIGIYTVALSSSLVFGPALEGIVAGSYSGLRPVFLAFFPFVLASVLLIAVRHVFHARSGGGGQPGRRAAALPTMKDARRLLSSRGFLLPTLGQMSYSIVFASILSFGGILAEQSIGAGYGMVFYLFGAFFATSWATRIVLTLAPDVRRKTLLLSISIVVSVAGMSMIRFSNSAPLMFLSFAILGIPHGLQYPVSTMMIAQATPRERLPVANALFTSAGAIPFAAAPIAIGYLSGTFGLPVSFMLMALPVVGIWLAFLFVQFTFKTEDEAAPSF